MLLIVFLLRSFLAEPFKIPSSSMRPTLEVGDFILVNKFAYGIRLPIIEQKIVPIADPQRGDVVVFRYPVNPSQDFIKRVVGVPRRQVVYRDKQLTVNGKPLAAASRRHATAISRACASRRWSSSSSRPCRATARKTTLGRRRSAGAGGEPGQVRPFPGRENCDYNRRQRLHLQVPAGHYFMMGDNRDRSDDSRYWGFVPDDHMRGRRSSSGSTGTTSRASRSSASAAAFDKGERRCRCERGSAG